MNTTKFLSMLGLSRRAGKIAIGTPLVTSLLPSGKVMIVFYTADSSKNTEKRITDKCKFYNVQCVRLEIPSEQIGKMVGMKTNVCVFGVTDDSFTKQLLSLSLE